jgi:hypothetical protein
MGSTGSEASVMSLGVPKVVNMLKKASSPWGERKRVVSTSACGPERDPAPAVVPSSASSSAS